MDIATLETRMAQLKAQVEDLDSELKAVKAQQGPETRADAAAEGATLGEGPQSGAEGFSDLLREWVFPLPQRRGEVAVLLGWAELASEEPRGFNILGYLDTNRECEDPEQYKAWFNCPERLITRFLSAFSHEARITLMRALFDEHRTTTQLKALGISHGQLYHHLKDLMLAGYVGKEKRDTYALTMRGRAAYSIMASLAVRMEEHFFQEAESKQTGR